MKPELKDKLLDFVDKNQGMSVNTRNEIEKKLNIQNQQQTASNYAANKEETVLYAKNTGTGGAVDIAGITSFLSEQKKLLRSFQGDPPKGVDSSRFSCHF